MRWVVCQVCGEAFNTHRSHTKTCSPRCRKRLQRSEGIEAGLLEVFTDMRLLEVPGSHHNREPGAWMPAAQVFEEEDPPHPLAKQWRFPLAAYSDEDLLPYERRWLRREVAA